MILLKTAWYSYMNKEFMDCFEAGSKFNISYHDGEFKEVDSSGNSLTKVEVFGDAKNVLCHELIEVNDSGFAAYTTISGTNKIVFTKDKQIVSKQFCEVQEV